MTSKNCSITAPKGFRAAGVHSGLKANNGLDLGLLVCDEPAVAAGAFTRNAVVAAPVELSRDHLKAQRARAIVVNSKNANACTGSRGLADAARMAETTAGHLGISSREVLVASTGVIGEFLPMNKIEAGIASASTQLADTAGAGRDFARSILTTDTKIKVAYRECECDDKKVRIAGAAKGSGMIAPNMATMLAFITTDVAITAGGLQLCLGQAVESSFNRITVDGQCSTNDSVFIMASGMAGNSPIHSAWGSAFAENLVEVCNELALAIVRDGEGATRVFHVVVRGAASHTDARLVSRSVADSPLVKTAVYAGDPNWGRIVQAAGASGAAVDPQRMTCDIGTVRVFDKGIAADFEESDAADQMLQDDVWIELDLGSGDGVAVTHSCDLSKKYVTINADYRT